jgi:surfeit locus 1 family protein
VLTLCAGLAFAALISLGVWQLQRREWKEDLIARAEARLASAPIPFDEALARAESGEDMNYQPVRLAGVYAHDLQSSVFGVHDGAAGVLLFTPLETPDPKTGGRRLVYVNRGFVPQIVAQAGGASRPQGEVIVEGLFRAPERRAGFARAFRPKDQPEDNLYFIRDPAVLAARHAISAPDYYVDGSNRESAGEWPRGGLTRIEFSNRHFEYALTWFALAGALAVIYARLSVERR